MERYADRKVRVLVVWEPILATDWRAPSGKTQARIHDRRARQFWDPKHFVAEELARLAKQKSWPLEPECCVSKGFHWDEAVLYAPQARWSEGLAPVYWNGAVYRIAPALEQALKAKP